MKRILTFMLIIVISYLSITVVKAQSCTSNQQQLYLGKSDYPNITNVCVNNSAVFKIFVEPERWDSWDEYGYQQTGYNLVEITLKKPDGSSALVITEPMYTIGSGYYEYTFPIGFFNVVGDWKFSFYTTDYCLGWSGTSVTTLKVVGAYTNSIGSDEIMCNSGGVPQNIVNVSVTSNSSSGILYSWQNKIGSGSWTSISGANLESYQTSYINQTTRYRRIVTTNELSCNSISNEVVKNVYNPLTGGTLTANQSVCSSSSPTSISETVASSGGSSGPNYSYKWYISTDNSNWSEIVGATLVSYQPSYYTGVRYYKRKTIDASCGEAFSTSTQVYGYAPITSGSIGSDQLICYNATPAPLTVTVAESGGYGGYSYKWYISTDNSNWTEIVAATSATYQPTSLTAKRYYRKSVINSCGTLYTNSVTVDVRSQFLSGTIGNDQTICYNSTPSQLATSVNPSGASNSFTNQWESSVNNTTWNTIVGATLLSYQPPALTQKMYYRKKVTDANCSYIYTNTITTTVRNAFNVGTIGTNQTICYNAIPNVIGTVITPSGGEGTYSYQWEYSIDNSLFLNITGATSATYQPSNLTQTTHYRRKVTDASCGNGYSNTVTITVQSNFNVGTVGSSQTICYNSVPTLLNTIVATSGGMGSYTYLWEYSVNGTDWSVIVGATSASYQPGALIQTTYYRRKVTDASCGNGYNSTVTITVRSQFNAGGLSSDQTICYNSTPSLITTIVSPTGGSGAFTYTWESSLDGTTWNVISGAVSPSYQGPVLTEKMYYRKGVVDVCGSGYTAPVIINIRGQLNYGSIGSSQTICYNTQPSILSTIVAPSGGTGIYTYAWESSLNNSTWSPIVGATGEGYQPNNLTVTTYFRRKVINTCGSDYTNVVTVTVRPIVVAGSISSNQTICFNSIPSLLQTSVYPSGGSGSFTFQWESSTDNSNWSTISGATNETYQPSALSSSIYYRRAETSGSCGIVNTNSVQITVNSQLIAGTVKSDQTICYNTSPSIFLTNSYPIGGTGSYTYQWQKLIGSSWTDIAGATSETYTPLSLTATSYFRRAETSGSCGTVYSNQITVAVYGQYLAGVIGSSQTVNYSAAPTEFVSIQPATGADNVFTYQWKNSLDNSVWSNISGATNESYQAPALTQKTYYKRSTVNASCGIIESNVITVNVNVQLDAGEIASNQTICYSTTPTQLTSSIASSGGNGIYSYQWQKMEEGGGWIDVVGATYESYQPNTLVKTTYFRKKVVSSSNEAYTNIVTITVYDNLVAGVVGLDQTICNGATPDPINVVIMPSGGKGNYTYQWKVSQNGSSWSDIVGAVNSYYEPSVLTQKTYFKKVVTDQCGVKESNTVTISVNQVFVAGTIGSNQTIIFGTVPSKLEVSVAPIGGNGVYTYQWQSSVDNSVWTNISGAASSDYTPGVLTQTTYFKRLTSSGCGTLETNVVVITVTNEVLVGTIGNDQSICNNSIPSLLTTLTQPSQGVVINSKNWQKSEDGSNWLDILAATADTYHPLALTITTYYRKKMVTAQNGTIYTNIVTVSVSAPFSIGSIGNDQFVCKTYASTPVITLVQPNGTNIHNQWQISDNNASWSDIVGATNDYYDAGILGSSKYFRKMVTSGCGNGFTNSVKITVGEELQGGSIGSDQAIANNTNPALLVGTIPVGGSGVYTYQWYYSLNNTDWQVVISNGNGKDYQPESLTQKTYFKRSVSCGSCGVQYSNIVTITVYDGLIPGTVSAAQSICYNYVPTLLTGTSPSGGTGQYSYQWQKSEDGSTWFNILGEVGISYRPSAITVNTYFRRTAISGNSSVNSNYIMISVFDQIAAPSTDIKAGYCKNKRVELNVTNAQYLSYKWYDSQRNYLMDGTKYTVDNLSANKTVYIRSVSNNGCLSDYLQQDLVVDNVKAYFSSDITKVVIGNAVKFNNSSVNAASSIWNFNDGDLIYEENPTHYYNSLGGLTEKKYDVSLKVISISGCKDSLTVANAITVVTTVTGVDEKGIDKLKLFPNPIDDKLNIIGDKKIKMVRVYSIIGKLLHTQMCDSENVLVDFERLNTGIYMVEVYRENGEKINVKMIKK